MKIKNISQEYKRFHIKLPVLETKHIFKTKKKIKKKNLYNQHNGLFCITQIVPHIDRSLGCII